MKVLHVITGLDRGGAETQLTRLLSRFAFPNVVVSLTDEGSLGPELRASGVPVTALGMRRGRPSPVAISRLRTIIRRERPDILQTWLYHADLLGLMAWLFSPSLPLVWNLRCSDLDMSKYPIATRASQWLLARFARLPAAIIVNSEAGRAVHQHLGYKPRKWVLIPNGFETSRFRPDATARLILRSEWNVDDDNLLIAMIARVDPMKDYENFLGAAERIAAINSNARFIVAGHGTEKLSVPKMISGRLLKLGERSDVPNLLAAVDLIILSSAFGEGFPNIIGEAMSCGVPCVSTSVGDAAQIIGDTGRIVPPRDSVALADAALEVLARGKVAGIAARQRIVANYGLEKIMDHYEKLYLSLSKGGGSPEFQPIGKISEPQHSDAASL